MRSRALLAVTFASVLASIACAPVQKGAAAVLKPSQVSPTFKDLDKENPFTKGANKIELTKVGMANYDTFFQESAEVKGTVILADVVLKEADALIAKTKKEVSKGAVLTPPQVAAINREKARVDAVTKLVGGVPDRSSTLMAQGEGLMKAAPKQLAGPQALKLPGVMKGLEQSMKSLRDAAARSPAVLEHAGKTSASLAGL